MDTDGSSPDVVFGDLQSSLLHFAQEYESKGTVLDDICFGKLYQKLVGLLSTASSAQASSDLLRNAPSVRATKDFNDSVSRSRQMLQDKCEVLQQAVHHARAVIEDTGKFKIEPSLAGAQELITHSHKLARREEQRAADAKSTVEVHVSEQKNTEPAGMFDLPIPAMPRGWKPGDPIPIPEGWKPGMPLPNFTDVAPPTTEPELASVPPAAGEGNMDNLNLDAGIDDDFILNAEAVDFSNEESSDEDDDDDDDNDAEEEEEDGAVDSDDE